MTTKQRIKMMAEWWPAACAAQGWREGDRELRLRVMALAISFAFQDQQEFREALADFDNLYTHPKFRRIKSANELNETTDVDAVKRVLLMMGDNLKGADEVAHPEHGQSRRFRDVLRDHMRCLAIYPLAQPMGMAGARRMVEELANDKFNHNHRVERIAIEDVSDAPVFYTDKAGVRREGYSHLEQLVMSVARVLNGKTGFRSRAGHSMHDMLTSAGLPCGCRKCVGSGRVFLAPAVAEIDPQPEEVSAEADCPF